MNHEITKKAEHVKNSTLSDIQDMLSGQFHSQFLENLENIQGVLYNPVTHTPIEGEKELQILAQAKDTTDPRFILEIHTETENLPPIDNAQKIQLINRSVEKDTLTKELTLKERTYNVINAREITKFSNTKPIQYTKEEREKLLQNLEKRVQETNNRLTRLFDQSYGSNVVNGIPKANVQNFITLMDAVENRDRLLSEDKNIPRDLLRGYKAETRMDLSQYKHTWVTQPYTKEEKAEVDDRFARTCFKNALAASLLARELGVEPPLKYILKDPDMSNNLRKTYLESKNCREKLIEDIQLARNIKKIMKEKILFQVKTRKTREEIKTMEKNYKENPYSKPLTPKDYYHYTPMNIESLEHKIGHDRTITTELDKKMDKMFADFKQKLKVMEKEQLNPEKIQEKVKKAIKSAKGKKARHDTFDKSQKSTNKENTMIYQIGAMDGQEKINGWDLIEAHSEKEALNFASRLFDQRENNERPFSYASPYEPVILEKHPTMKEFGYGIKDLTPIKAHNKPMPFEIEIQKLDQKTKKQIESQKSNNILTPKNPSHKAKKRTSRPRGSERE